MPQFPTYKTAIRSISFLGVMAASKAESAPLSIRPYTPQNPDGLFPYSAKDLTPADPGNDMSFYSVPR